MTFTLSLFIQGTPKGQPRPQAFTRKIKCRECAGSGRDGGMESGVECPKCRGTGEAYYAGVYDPGVASEWKNRVAFEIRQHLPPAPLEGPIAVSLKFLLPRPKSAMRAKDPEGVMVCTTRPDLDNLEKSVLDALTQMGLWHDDAQIVMLESSKSYHGKTDRPGMWLAVREVEA